MTERRLLLVDDEDNILRSLVRLLRRDGYQILTASNGREGLKVLEEHDVGVIVSDQRMPEMNGVEFLGEVKKRYPDTVRIVLSGYTELNSVTDAINEGAIYKFFTKPWDDDLLRKNIREAFQYYELRSENQRLAGELKKANELLMGDKRNLEQLVQAKVEELTLNMGVLKIAQEVLERLPVGVLGIGEEGIIAVANHKAQGLLGSASAGLVGFLAGEVLPGEIHRLVLEVKETGMARAGTLALGSGVEVAFHCCPMDEQCGGRGEIVVLVEKER